jgi:hypothetical protein
MDDTWIGILIRKRVRQKQAEATLDTASSLAGIY